MHDSIFKAYDIRGTWPDQINAREGYAIAQAYAKVVKPKGPVVVGYDVRLHSKELADQVIEGLTASGIDITAIGLVSTEMMYFAVGQLKTGGGIQVTASHNPPEWHGMKMVREGVAPVGSEMIQTIKSQIQNPSIKYQSGKKGTITEKNLLNDYIDYALGWIDSKTLDPMKVVYNANFGFEGKLLEALVSKTKLPLTLVPLNAEPDGSFPKGRPDPFVPENRPEFVELVKSSKADLGVAWDADADRVFFCAEDGTFLESYHTNLLLIEKMLAKDPGSTIVYDPRYIWATVAITKQFGGKPVLSKVGHSNIKVAMRERNAIFSGESSGHTYFRDFWYADAGIIPLLLILELLSKSGKKLSELVKPYLEKYPISGEINSKVSDVPAVFKLLEQKYDDAKIDHFDGLSIEYPNWRANIRSSNTEPLLRLNVEAKNQVLMEQKRDELLDLIRS